MGELVVPFVALGTAAFLFLLVVGALAVRRYLLGRGIGAFDCSLRAEGRRGGAGAWTLGVARYEHDRLDWFRVFALTHRADHTLNRSWLSILDHRAPLGSELHAVLPGWVIVRCDYAGSVLEFAMSEPAYSGLATWLESAPPGQNIAIN